MEKIYLSVWKQSELVYFNNKTQKSLSQINQNFNINLLQLHYKILKHNSHKHFS